MPKSIKKFLPYILILTILAGLLVFTHNVEASPTNPHEPCAHPRGPGMGNVYTNIPCDEPPGVNHTTTVGDVTTPGYGQQSTVADNEFQRRIDKGCDGILSSTFNGCFLKLVYYVVFALPSLLLWLSAQFFNAMISIGISSTVTSASSFIPEAWAVVRDFANIFFILILLYVAIQTILGTSHDTKKVIVQVMIMALLINFSMFFTKVVIDTSNILALVFYNKLDVRTENPDSTTKREYETSTTTNEKDISGAMYRNFNATTLLDGPALERLNTTNINGTVHKEADMPLGITVGIIFIAGFIMLYAAYVFFVAGISFLGRLIELWILIIFSPFAFMSNTIPKFASVSYLGWEAWTKRLISTAFMAPIFMFFMYLIFKLLGVMPAFSSGEGAIATILTILIPALIIMAMLRKAVHYAEEGGGEFGKAFVKIGKTAAVVAGGLAMGGTALLAQGVVGQASSKLANSEWAKKRESEGKFGGAAIRNIAKYGASSSFDVRKGAIGGAFKAVEAVTGMNLGATSRALTRDGGFEADRKRKVENRIKRAKELEVGEDEGLKQNVRNTESALHEAETGTLTDKAGNKVYEKDAAGNDIVDAKGNKVERKRQDEIVSLKNGDSSQVANTKLNTANNSLATDATAQALKLAQTKAETDSATANAALATNPTDVTAQTNALAAANALATANKAWAANPLVIAQAVAEVATKGLGTLERVAAKNEKRLADAERELKDAINTFGTKSAQADIARIAQADALINRNVSDTNLEKRKEDIRTAEGPIHDRERDLKLAENAVAVENASRRHHYAAYIQTGLLPTIGFLNAGMANARREAANKIRAGASVSGGGGHGGGHAPAAVAHAPAAPAPAPAAAPAAAAPASGAHHTP